MDMKSYILVGGGLLICLVLLHALWSAWKVHRKAGGGDADAAHDASDMHIAQADRDASQWSDEALQEELTGVKRVGEADAEETPPPVLMEATAGAVDEQDDATAREEIDATANLGSIAGEADGITASGDYSATSHRGRRINIPGKRTEPSVPRALRTEDVDVAESTVQQPPPPVTNGGGELDDVLIIWVLSKPGKLLDGEGLLKEFVAKGLKCDADGVFKKRDPRGGGLWYTVANGVEPGIFDISSPDALTTPGIVMLLRFGNIGDPSGAFEDMLDVAQALAITFEADLKDEQRSDMSAQTIEHCRQRIRDFKRMLLRA